MQNQVYQTRQEDGVRSTINYKQFKLSKENRPVNEDHAMKLYDAIEKKNLLKEFPILVDKDLTVIDGQHRLKVAESLQIPIYYIMSDRITVDDISETNQNTRKWTMKDYLSRWVAAGNLDYLALDRFWKKYSFLKLTTVIGLCHYGDRIRMNRMFSSGQYRCNDVAFGERVMTALLELSKHTKLWNNTTFIYAYQNLMSNSVFEHKRMMAKMEYLSTRLVRCATTEEYINLINDEIYNYKALKENVVELKKINSNDKNFRVDRRRRQQDLIAA